MLERKKAAQISGSLVGLSHWRFKLQKHQHHCKACRYGDCKDYVLLELDYLKMIDKHKELARRLTA